jgi:hypothetical protein
MAKSKIILLIIVVVIIIAAVVLAVVLTGKKGPGGEEEKPLIEEGVVIATEIYGFSAQITGIKDKTLSLDASILLADATQAPITVPIKVSVTDETKITKLEFPKDIPEGSTEPIYPKETALSLNDLKVGDKIHAVAVENVSEKIKSGTEFPIKEILMVVR